MIFCIYDLLVLYYNVDRDMIKLYNILRGRDGGGKSYSRARDTTSRKAD